MRLIVLLLSLMLVMPLALADGSDGGRDQPPGDGPGRRDQAPPHSNEDNETESPRPANGNGPPRDAGDQDGESTNGTRPGPSGNNSNGGRPADDRPGNGGNGSNGDNRSTEGNGTSRDDEPDDSDRDREADDRDDDEADEPRPSRGRRVHDDASGFRTMPDSAQDRRPAVSFQADRASTAVQEPGVRPLDLHVESVLEFRDEDGDGAYDLAEPVLQRFALRDLVPVINASADSVRDVTYGLPAGGAITLRFHFQDADQEGAKFDVIVRDFPFAANDTFVAVAVHVEVPGGLRFAEVAGEPALAGVAGERVPFISWARNVTVDDVDREVQASAHVSVDPQQATGLLFWSYPQGAEIIHDPVLGVTLIPAFTLANPSAYAVAVLGGIAALAVGFEARRRFRP